MPRIDRLCVNHGLATALTDVSVEVNENELVAVIGPNGAGKTTLVNAIARFLPVKGGEIFFEGENVTRLSPLELGARGVALIPEGRRLFTSMTVEENLDIGCYRTAARAERAASLAHIFDMFPVLRERRRQIAGTLSGGQQQMVAIARALMARPRLLLIDEPCLGLAPIIVNQVFEVIETIRSSGVAILLIEQNAVKALKIAQRGYVLDCGNIVAQGTPAELEAQGDIKAAYLGAH